MVHGALQLVLHSIDLHENLIQMPLPIRISTKLLDSILADFFGEHRAKPVPPEPDSFMADIDAAFMEKIFQDSKKERKPNIQHHRQADDLRGRVEVAKRGFHKHISKLLPSPNRLKPI